MNLLKKMISVILLLASCLIAANVPTMSLRELKIRLRFCQAQVCFEMNSTAYSTIWHVSNRVNLNFRLATNVRKQWNMGLQQQSLKGCDNFEYEFNFCPFNYRSGQKNRLKILNVQFHFVCNRQLLSKTVHFPTLKFLNPDEQVNSINCSGLLEIVRNAQMLQTQILQIKWFLLGFQNMPHQIWLI